jgi:hypothetical protein
MMIRRTPSSSSQWVNSGTVMPPATFCPPVMATTLLYSSL